jgi:hypothetical protein
MSSIYSLSEKAFRIQLKISMAMNRISKHVGDENSHHLWVAPENRNRFEQLRGRRQKILDKYKFQ